MLTLREQVTRIESAVIEAFKLIEINVNCMNQRSTRIASRSFYFVFHNATTSAVASSFSLSSPQQRLNFQENKFIIVSLVRVA